MAYSSFLNSSIVSPESLIMPAIVNEWTGLARGIVIMCSPSVIVVCLPS